MNNSQDKSFAGQHVLITGGGSGIGRATALAFASQGAASVIITGRRTEPLAQVGALHPAIVPVTADVSSEDGATAAAEAVGERGGVLDVLVHNAGIVRVSPLDVLGVPAVREVLNINVLGPVLLTARLLPLLRSPGGNIVFVSSVVGHMPVVGSSVYAASKAAVDSLTRSWAKELAPKGIRVNAVAPGTVDTTILVDGGLSADLIGQMRAEHDATVPAGRAGEPDEIAPWITRLAEPASSWVTGKVFTIDGGADLV